MSRPDRLSLAPPYRLTYDTAATLSLRINTGSPSNAGLSPTSSSIVQAVTTIPRSSNRLILMVQVSRSSALRFNSAATSFGKSYRH